MKKGLTVILCASLLLSSGCATIFGGKIDECQRTKPAAGQPARQVRVVALLADILLPLSVAAASGGVGLGFIIWPAVDFIDNAIYKPCRYIKVKVEEPKK